MRDDSIPSQEEPAIRHRSSQFVPSLGIQDSKTHLPWVFRVLSPSWSFLFPLSLMFFSWVGKLILELGGWLDWAWFWRPDRQCVLDLPGTQAVSLRIPGALGSPPEPAREKAFSAQRLREQSHPKKQECCSVRFIRVRHLGALGSPSPKHCIHLCSQELSFSVPPPSQPPLLTFQVRS